MGIGVKKEIEFCGFYCTDVLEYKSFVTGNCIGKCFSEEVVLGIVF